MRLLSDIHETTLLYPPAGGERGRPRARTRPASLDDTQRQLSDALHLTDHAPTGV